MITALIIVLGAAILALICALVFWRAILRKPSGNKKMADAAKAIRGEAMAFIKKQYYITSIVGLALFVIILYMLGLETALGFAAGAILATCVGYISVTLSTQANVRTAEAAQEGIAFAANVACKSGMALSSFVYGLALIAVGGFYILTKDAQSLTGLGLGGAIIALFGHLGGGIFTKAADIGADLAGKIEKNLSEDSPNNPASIADNAGDNVGDGAGMAVDLFATFCVASIAAIILIRFIFPSLDKLAFLPLVMGSASAISAIIGNFFVRVNKKSKNVKAAIYRGLIISFVLSAGAFYFITAYLFQPIGSYSVINISAASMLGLLAVALIVIISEYFTSDKFAPVEKIAASSVHGPGAVIIAGLSMSMKSVALPVLTIGAAVFGAYSLADFFGLAVLSMGMASMAGVFLTLNMFGVVSDNAGGIGRMAEISKEAKENIFALDLAGNTMKAAAKSYAAATAFLAALALFIGYAFKLGESGASYSFNLVDPYVWAGLLLGGTLTYYFCSIVMEEVLKTAGLVACQARNQLNNMLGGALKPDYKRIVSIATVSAVKGMILPALIVFIVPILIGFILGPVSLGGFLIGTAITGLFLAISMTLGGGAWDNSKKLVERERQNGNKSVLLQAAITADIVGDPYKDAAGPSIAPALILTGLIALLIAPIILSINLSFEIKMIIVVVIVLLIAALIIFGKKTKSGAR